MRLSVSAAYPASTELVRIKTICVSVNLTGDLRGNAISTKDPVSTVPRSEGVARKVPTRASANQVGYFIFENLNARTQSQRSANQTDKFETQNKTGYVCHAPLITFSQAYEISASKRTSSTISLQTSPLISWLTVKAPCNYFCFGF